MAYFLQQLINGLTLGSIYGLIAIGYTMVYGIIGMINFAHGELITFAAYALLALFGLPTPVMLFGAMVVAVALALITERAAFRPLRYADPTTRYTRAPITTSNTVASVGVGSAAARSYLASTTKTCAAL